MRRDRPISSPVRGWRARGGAGCKRQMGGGRERRKGESAMTLCGRAGRRRGRFAIRFCWRVEGRGDGEGRCRRNGMCWGLGAPARQGAEQLMERRTRWTPPRGEGLLHPLRARALGRAHGDPPTDARLAIYRAVFRDPSSARAAWLGQARSQGRGTRRRAAFFFFVARAVMRVVGGCGVGQAVRFSRPSRLCGSSAPFGLSGTSNTACGLQSHNEALGAKGVAENRSIDSAPFTNGRARRARASRPREAARVPPLSLSISLSLSLGRARPPKQTNKPLLTPPP
jgi:hypothetical protein